MVGNGEVVTVVAGVNEGSTLIIVILGYSLRNISSPLKIGEKDVWKKPYEQNLTALGETHTTRIPQPTANLG